MTVTRKPTRSGETLPGRIRRALRTASGACAKQPLLRFLVLGALLFGGDVLWRDDRSALAPPPSTPGNPTPSDEELWFREALRAGLHESDAIVRRRLARNMRFTQGDADPRSDAELVADAINLGMHESDLVVRRRLVQKLKLDIHARVRSQPPSEDALRAWHAAQAARFTEPARLQLSQLYFRDRGRADAALRNGPGAPDAPAASGDALPLPRHLPPHSKRELAHRFGPAFAEAAFQTPLESWSGPVASAFGHHLLWAHARTPARVSAFEVVRREVREALLFDRAEAAVAAATRTLRKRYGIVRDDESEAP